MLSIFIINFLACPAKDTGKVLIYVLFWIVHRHPVMPSDFNHAVPPAATLNCASISS